MSEISYQLRLIADETTYPVLLGEAADEIDRLERRRGGECQKCGRWVCPPLTCMACLADAPEELRAINAKLTAEIERLTRERDALLRACYRQEGVDAFYTCHPASESYGHRFRSEAEVVAAIRSTAGLEVAG